jgi:predicted RNase H-like nuclease
MSSNSDSIIVVGIDVGGARKGLHAVALEGGQYLNQASFKAKDDEESGPTAAERLAAWCRVYKPLMIAVDAPCRWSTDGGCRPGERALAKKRITCFATPKREKAVDPAVINFRWMLEGEKVYQALARTHPLATAKPQPGQQCCFETYPHAITWHLRGDNAQAPQKRQQRRELLDKAKIDLTKLTNIDLVDAALCALTAHHAAMGWSLCEYGDAETGVIIVPELKP